MPNMDIDSIRQRLESAIIYLDGDIPNPPTEQEIKMARHNIKAAIKELKKGESK